MSEHVHGLFIHIVLKASVQSLFLMLEVKKNRLVIESSRTAAKWSLLTILTILGSYELRFRAICVQFEHPGTELLNAKDLCVALLPFIDFSFQLCCFYLSTTENRSGLSHMTSLENTNSVLHLRKMKIVFSDPSCKIQNCCHLQRQRKDEKHNL